MIGGILDQLGAYGGICEGDDKERSWNNHNVDEDWSDVFGKGRMEIAYVAWIENWVVTTDIIMWDWNDELLRMTATLSTCWEGEREELSY